jgi:hypothetical protein
MLGVVSSAVVLTLLAVRATAQSSDSSVVLGSNIAPSTVEEYARGYLSSKYGADPVIYQEATTTLGDWVSLEPLNNQGRDLSLSATDLSVYALFVQGDFSVPVPDLSSDTHQTIAHFAAGRIVIGADGRFLSLQLWKEVRPADEGFGASFDAG